MTTPTQNDAFTAPAFGDQRNPANRALRAAFFADMAQAELDNAAFDAMLAEADEMALLPRSVVPIRYKVAYRNAAAARGATTKAAARCNGDWLARKLESLVLRTAIVHNDNGTVESKQVLDVEALEAILDANGIEQWRTWGRSSPGWQGRMRMNGSQMLRSRIAKANSFVLPDGSTIVPPTGFTDKYC